jgi:hypothetical protein
MPWATTRSNPVTEWTKDEWTTLSFQGTSLESDPKNPIPYFEVSRRHLVGFFVEFTYRSDDKARPTQSAIIIGADVFVTEDNYKPRSYRGERQSPVQ